MLSLEFFVFILAQSTHACRGVHILARSPTGVILRSLERILSRGWASWNRKHLLGEFGAREVADQHLASAERRQHRWRRRPLGEAARHSRCGAHLSACHPAVTVEAGAESRVELLWQAISAARKVVFCCSPRSFAYF